MPPSSALTVTALADSTRETEQQALRIIRRHFEAREPALQPRSPAFAAGFGMAEQHAAEPLKHCPGCGLRKPLSMFHKNKSKPDAHASNCKTCANAGVQRKRQAKRELDAAGAPQQQQQLRGRHAAGLSSAILDVAAAAHRGGSEDDGPHGGSPTDANLQQHFYGRQHSMPPQLYAGGTFGGGGQLGTRSISVGASLGGAAFGSLAASPPGQVAGTTGAFGAGGSGLHAAHALASGQTLQQALAAQQQARIAELQGFGSSGGMADGDISPFAAAAVAAVASSSAAAAGGGATKLCRNCFMERPVLGHFEPSPQEPDGLSPNCRTCTAAADLLAWVQQEAEMAKVTLQAVRAQHGDDSPAALVAFHSAVAAHNAYIQALAAMRPQQQPDAAAAGAGPVAAAVAAMVAARQHEQDQIQALQQAQQMQKAAEWRQALQQAQLQALQAAQLQQDQSQMQQQPQWQQQLSQLQQQQLLLQPSLPSLRRPSPQRSGGTPMVGGSAQMTLSGAASVGDGTTAVTSAGAVAAAAEQQQQQRSANASPALQLGRLRSVARGLSLSLSVSPRALQGAVPLSTSTGSVAAAAAAAATAASGGGSAEASPAVSGAAPRAQALPQRSCFACGKPSAGSFALPMCEECQNAGPITAAAAATAAASAAGDYSGKAAAGKSDGVSPLAAAAAAADASGLEKLMTLGSLQNPLSSRSFSSTSSRSTAAQQLLALSGWGSDAEASLAGRLGSGFGAGFEGVRSDSERLRDALAGAGFSLGRLTSGGASGMLAAAAAAAQPDAAAQQASGADSIAARLAGGPSLPVPPVTRLLPGSAAGADAPAERLATPATLQPGPPPSSLAAALQHAAAAAPSAAKPGGDAGVQRPTANRRVSWNMAAVQPAGGSAAGDGPDSPAADKPPADE